MTNADLVWRLVNLLLNKDSDQVALDDPKKDAKPNAQKQDEV